MNVFEKLNKLDFRKLNSMNKELSDVQSGLAEIFDEMDILEGTIKTACQDVLFDKTLDSLEKVSVDELSKSRLGIRVSALKDAGFANLKQLAMATDREISEAEGVGEKQISSIRDIIAELQNRLVEVSSIKIDPDDLSKENTALIKALYKYIGLKNYIARNTALPLELGLMSEKLGEIENTDFARNGFQWFFSGRKKKERTADIMGSLKEILFGDHRRLADKYISDCKKIMTAGSKQAMSDFKTRSPEYYAVMEGISGAGHAKPLIYSSIPARLAAEIDAIELNLDGFVGTLRSYQKFGAKYVLHQGRALLGDDMGLGKTVQAIAVMCHLYGVPAALNYQEWDARKVYFLVICPASVLINWVREIKRFSSIPVHLVHGPYRDEEFNRWQEAGGVCVTNYETMGKIVDEIDNNMTLSLMVIDEAHYIKNPDAKRTKYIHALENESERILLMTGTPLENRVEEMCTLIDFLRPDMSERIRSVAKMSTVPEFREMLSDVYLRRLRSDVLDELPDLEHKMEWCQLTETDTTSYIKALRTRNFNEIRRVSFLQDDMRSSSKAMRLLELIEEAKEDGRKVIVYSFFRDTVEKVRLLLGDECAGVITGETPPDMRQKLIDDFSRCVLVAQIQAGGTGLNIQAASIVVFCEPQIKPSLENQALSRVYRMGQMRNVLVYQ